ncbi:MAG: acyl-CoA desaturase [Cytophagales bacterium]|nr:acyl-CoA desaturase [Cytophagales bacterium]
MEAYFAANRLDRNGNARLLTKSAVQICCAVALYVVLVFFTPPVALALPLCVLLGLHLAFIGFNVMHEGGHQSFSKHRWLNTSAGYFLNVLGGNIYFWKIKHNINHHTYTNIEGMDSDIDVKPFMRLHTEQPRRWFHKFQYLYWVMLYGISYVVWVFYHDFEKYFTGHVAAGNAQKTLARKEHVVFWLTKVCYVAVYLAIPIWQTGWLAALIGFVVVTFVCGLAISVVFQLAHVVEGTDFPQPQAGSGRMEREWAVHQVVTTADFATHNRVLSWLLGGLNFQVEHHLFPRISHVHYPAINRLVKETCREHGVPYLEYPSMRKAFASHLAHIRKMGNA